MFDTSKNYVGMDVGKSKNTIEINGQRYDATTGALISDVSRPHRATATHAKAMHQATKSKTIAVKMVSKPEHKVATHRVVQHAKAHQPSSAKTLMRRAVNKPGTPLKRHAKAHGPSEVMAKPTTKLKLSQSVYRTNERRLAQSQAVNQSKAISHFTSVQPGSVVQPTRQLVAPSPIQPKKQPKTTADLLEQALHHANGHQQNEVPRRRNRRTGLALAGVAALLLIGVVGSQSITPLRMQVASSRAGFEAALPDYKPAGFSMGKLHYGPGEVAARFNSNSNDTSYTIVQQPTNFDSQGLLENVVAPADANYRMVSEGGRTIYLYGQRTVTWVSGGIWYQIQDHDSLSDTQLLEIANSL